MANRRGKSGSNGGFYFPAVPSADGDCSHKIQRQLLLGKKAMTNLDSILKSRDITDKGLSSQSYGFSSSHVWMWELDHKESWVLKTDAFELWCWRRKTFESPLDSNEVKLVNPKGNQPWIFVVRAGAEAEILILRQPDVKNWHTGKDSDAGRYWEQG